MLTPTKSRPHHSAGRSAFIALLVLAVIATIAGVAYLLTRSGSSAGHKAGSTPVTTAAGAVTTSAAPTSTASSAPPASQLPPGVVPFVALPVGTPPTPGVSEAQYPWHQLKASLQGPTTVSAGSTVTVTVTLRNPTGAAISLDPCPSYDIDVGLRTSSYGLNCAAAPTTEIAPGGSLTFAVQAYVPSSIGSGTSTIAWTLGWQSDKASPHAQLKVAVQ